MNSHRPCWAEINMTALRHNWRALRQKTSSQAAMLAVVKANGYGLGLLTVAKIAVEEGAAYLGVSSVEEGIALREGGIKAPILILGSLYPFESFPLLFDYQLTPTMASLEAAEALNTLALKKNRRWPVHLKIDSGFGRIGVSIASAPSVVEQIAAMKGLVLEGLYTHFASSDVDEPYTHAQAEAFQKVVEAVQAKGIRPPFIHMANSSALIRFPMTHGTLVRPGLAFYGVAPYAEAARDIQLMPALTWKSRVIFYKAVPAGASISYARTFVASRPTRVATLAVGYADGFPRHLSNCGQVLIRGRRAPILGRVTMDMTMVDVTDHPECFVGDEAVLLGTQGSQKIQATEMAEWAATNAYDILCRIGARVPRVVVHG